MTNENYAGDSISDYARQQEQKLRQMRDPKLTIEVTNFCVNCDHVVVPVGVPGLLGSRVSAAEYKCKHPGIISRQEGYRVLGAQAVYIQCVRARADGAVCGEFGELFEQYTPKLHSQHPTDLNPYGSSNS